MDRDRLRDALGPGEALRFEAPLRRGGRLGVTDTRMLVVRDEIESVPLGNVEGVTITDYDWFLVVLSVALAGVGLYGLVVVGDFLLGFAFVVAGIANLVLTHRKHGRVAIRLHSGGTPIVTYVDDSDDVRAALRRAIESYEAELDD